MIVRQKNAKNLLQSARKVILIPNILLQLTLIMKEEAKGLACSDQQLSILFNEYEIREPQLSCKSSQRVVRMCVNSECKKNSLMCNDINCDSCGMKNHKRCSNVFFGDITDMLAERANRQKDFLIKVCDIQNQFIQELHKSRRSLTKQYYLGDLEENYLQIVEKIYKNKNTQFLNGKQGKEFFERLDRSYEQANQHAALLLENYKTSMKKLIDEMLQLKSKLYESFVKTADLVNQKRFIIDSLILAKPFGVNLQEFKAYNSLVVKHSKSLTEELSFQQMNFLNQILNHPKQLQLLYRGSANGFSCYTFHQKCDNIPNTLTLVRTQFGKTIGGFTQYAWNAASSNYFSQSGKHSFIFSLDLKEKYVPAGTDNLIYCNNGYGPTFGNGHDLYVAHQCNANANSHANFPYVYNKEGQNKYVKNQDSYKAFIGATNGYSFRVIEYETFRVVWS